MLFLLLGLFVSVTVTSAFHMSGMPEKTKIDKIFNNYVETNHFQEAQLGIMRGSDLIYGEQRGDMAASQIFPIQDLSKTFTAVAILQLVEEGLLSLDAVVFGQAGILSHLKPVDNLLMDSRIFDVTVEHLLRHTGGWDEREAPLYDPMMNAVLLELGKPVPNIAAELDKSAEDDLTQEDITRYVMAQTLQYTPGERIVQSNFGYCLLGQIIEHVTGKPYEDHVKDHVLKPAGMWHTKLGRRDARLRVMNENLDESERRLYDKAYKKLSFKLLDSTLGWYSNVFDIARFFTVLSYAGPTQLLQPETLTYALKRNVRFAKHHTDSWPGLGLTVQKDGVLTLESSDRILGLSVFIHKQPRSESTDDDTATRQESSLVIFIGYSTTYKKHLSPLQDAILSLNLQEVSHNAYIEDLSDTEVATDKTRVLIKTRLNEHKVEAYTNAMRLAGYFVRWLHGYRFDGHTNFIALFELASKPEQLRYKFMKSSSKVKLYKFISANSKYGYHVDAMQSFRSTSHDGHTVHYVLMKQLEHPNLIMFNLGSIYERYQIELPHLLREGYQVALQSMEHDTRETTVTYILQQRDTHNEEQTSTRAQDDVSIAELSIINKLQNQENYYISFIDSYIENGQQKFSLVFRQENHSVSAADNMTFETGIEATQFTTRATFMSSNGFLPIAVAAYQSNDNLFYAVQWTRHA